MAFLPNAHKRTLFVDSKVYPQLKELRAWKIKTFAVSGFEIMTVDNAVLIKSV